MANQTFQLVITGTAADQFVQNVFHFRMDPDSFSNRLLAAKGLVDGFLDADKSEKFLEMCPDSYVIKSIKCRQITDGGGPEWVDITQEGEVGTLGAGMSVPGVGPVIIWYIDGPPKCKGRTFIPGIPNGAIGGDEIASATITALNDAASDFRVAFNAIGGTAPAVAMCIPTTANPAIRFLVNGNAVSRIVGKQRRRQVPV